jgi:hypothetical protein
MASNPLDLAPISFYLQEQVGEPTSLDESKKRSEERILGAGGEAIAATAF